MPSPLVNKLLTLALICAATPSAVAQNSVPSPPSAGSPDESDDASSGGRALEEIVVTGSLIRGLPKEYVASPVFTYGQADIVQSGAGSVSEYMLTIPQNFTGDLSDFASSAASIGSTLGRGTSYNQFDGFASFALRGLASDATLTLLNGRRMPAVGMIESPTVSVIPAALIERIDIISDGASATYGADAVAGVVNIVTREISDCGELRVRGSTTTQNSANDWETSAMAGHSWDGGHAYGMAMYQKRGEFVDDPVVVSGVPLQITQLPNEGLGGLYAGIEQELGPFTLSLDASGFERDRDATQRYVDEPEDNRFFDARTKGYSLYSNLHWQGDGLTSADLHLDYHRNDTSSALHTGGVPSSARTYDNELLVAELNGQTTLASLPAGPLLMAGGMQYREETLRTDATIFFNRHGGTRKVKSVFSELNVPLVSRQQRVPLVQSLTLSAAARYEDLDFDDALAPKLGLRWQLNDAVALQGTYAHSFLTPRFRDTIGIGEQVSFWDYDYAYLDPADQNPALPPGNALLLFRAGANPDLNTQKADTFTFGITLTPQAIPGLSVKTGYYRIEIDDRISYASQIDSVSVADLQVFNTYGPDLALLQSIVGNPAVLRRTSVNVPFINGGRQTSYASADAIPAELLSQVQAIIDIRAQNFATERTDGIDLDLTYGAALFGGVASLRLSGQYILDLELEAGGGTAASRVDIYGTASDLRFNGTATWGRNGFSLGTVVNYVDGFSDVRPGEPVRKVGSYTTASLFLGFDLGRLRHEPWLADTELQFIVANVFDRQPPRIVNGVLGFDPFNNPPNPRTVGFLLNKRFGAGAG